MSESPVTEVKTRKSTAKRGLSCRDLPAAELSGRVDCFFLGNVVRWPKVEEGASASSPKEVVLEDFRSISLWLRLSTHPIREESAFAPTAGSLLSRAGNGDHSTTPSSDMTDGLAICHLPASEMAV
jgi:hypothetical protein